MNGLPRIFCWTKVGQEAGEDVVAIRRRKEWERQLGRGHFFWGVGQSLGTKARLASYITTPIPVLFSLMPSKAKLIDRAPSGVVLWNSWVDVEGRAYPLPDYCLITSRSHLPSGRTKARHYALVCSSDHELNEYHDRWISPQFLRNAATNKFLGASQVTAIVRSAQWSARDEGGRRYPVIFSATLHAPYFVRLADPIALAESDLARIKTACTAGDVQRWQALVHELRSRIRVRPAPAQQSLIFSASAKTPLEECIAR